MREKKLEVLAPAGSFESLRAAVNAGADAVYMGGSRFGARAYAQNPEGENLLAAIDYAHLHGVRLYLTVNTLLKTCLLYTSLWSLNLRSRQRHSICRKERKSVSCHRRHLTTRNLKI